MYNCAGGSRKGAEFMKKRVLLAEDEKNIVESISFLLRRAGFEVLVENNGRAALKSTLSAKPDVLVLDVMLPDLDGYELLRKLRQENVGQNMPVLMLTAKGQREDREMALKCGANRFITKPFSNAEIVAAVQELAEKPTAD